MATIPQNLGVPTGTIMWSAAPEPPVGWLLCDGRFVSPGDYPALYASIGNTYGGDEVSFALPDLVGRFIKGWGDLLGRDPFTYEDGENLIHKHGMFPDQVHDHTVTDPGHKHPMLPGAHTHPTTSDHDHLSTSDHGHGTKMPSTGVLLATTCAQSIYASPFRGSEACPKNPKDDDFLWDPKRTGITAVGTNVTGTSAQIAVTGVILTLQFTGISLEFAETGISIDNTGVIGGPQPKNIAFLPIIRT
jgi:microcystin-dependent protein